MGMMEITASERTANSDRNERRTYYKTPLYPVSYTHLTLLPRNKIHFYNVKLKNKKSMQSVFTNKYFIFV